jgi:hypothetical protein
MFQRYVATVVYQCCKSRSGCYTCCNGYIRCFKCMFQMFYLFPDVCCKHMFQVFSSVSYICLQVFHLDVAYDSIGFQIFFRRLHKCFRRLFQVFHLSFSVCYNCCIWMFQKVHWVLHMWFARGSSWRRGPTVGVLTRSLCEHRPNASAQIGRPDASKSVVWKVLNEQEKTCPKLMRLLCNWLIIELSHWRMDLITETQTRDRRTEDGWHDAADPPSPTRPHPRAIQK